MAPKPKQKTTQEKEKQTIKKPAIKKITVVAKAAPKSEKIQSLPVLVVRDGIVFPGFTTRMNVGRAESIKSIELALKKHNGYIVIVLQKNPSIKTIEINNISTVGVISKILKFENKSSEQKNSSIEITGVKKAILDDIKIGEIIITVPKQFKDQIISSQRLKEMHEKLVAQFKATISTLQIDVPKNQIEPFINSPTSELVDAFTQFIPAPTVLKNAILNEPVLENRVEFILDFLSTFQGQKVQDTQKKIEKDIQNKVKDKFSEQQKEFYLREQMKAIKEELDEINGMESELDVYRNKLNNNPYPKHIKEKLLLEVKRLEQTPSQSQEANIIRTYIDTVIDLPYWNKSEEIIDIKKATKILDKHHYGLEKVKERIIEYLALKKKNPDSKGTILCFVGAPGTGKTSLVKSIAEALNRKMIKVSLGGVRDEAEIRGHRRTYLASMPGKIILAMKKAGVINPVILLDELDKMSSDYKGDPASAMLEVLDPEQNKTFQDHFVEEEYDLSNVMFIATANYYDHIPHALFDRLEIIDVSSYTELEKLNIAKDHLIPRVLEETKLEPAKFKFNEETIKHIIRHYTMEAGVRQLHRVFDQIARKILVLDLNGKLKSSFKIDVSELSKIIGKEKYNFGKKEKTPQIGTATGLAWTAYGGDILPIEVTLYPGKGNLILTGSLKDVMKESASIALSFVKTNAKSFDIDLAQDGDKNIFNTNDFHFHVPEGATPKDGPSAGVTFTTAIISALTKKPISPLYGMTGEITLRGNVLPIGGLKEKSMSAYRSGLKEIFIPKDNEKDIVDIPKEVQKNLKIIAVEKYQDIYKRIFNVK